MSASGLSPLFEYTIRITRDISVDDMKAMMDLRREAYYGDPNDPRYGHGGLHNLYDESWIAESHAKDSTSHFVLVNDVVSGVLVAYSRFSFVEPADPSYDNRLRALVPVGSMGRAVWLQVTVTAAKLRGRDVSLGGRRGRISDISFDEWIAFARAKGCSVGFCDVATHPVRNEASLGYIARHGFQEVGEAECLVRNGTTVIFTRYAVAIR
jgi:hypothetical protein